MNLWYLSTVKFVKEFTDGTLKRVSENYLFEAVSFQDAEARSHDEIGQYVRGEFLVKTLAPKNYAEILSFEDSDEWYDVKSNYLLENESSGKTTTISKTYLVNAHSVIEAHDRLNTHLKGIMASYKITHVSLTKIMDVFPIEVKEND